MTYRRFAAALVLVVGCKEAASDKRPAGEGTVVLATPGDSPTPVTRAPLHAGKLRIVAHAGELTQTRVYAVTPTGDTLAFKATGDGMPLASELTLTVGPNGQIVEPPQKNGDHFASSDDYRAYQAENNADLQAARNELRWLFAPLPSAPIGVGTVWRFEQDHASSVGPMHQVILYEAVRRDANELELRVQVDATSNLNQTLHASGTVTLSIGSAGTLPRGSFRFANESAHGTLEMTPVD